MIAKSTLDELAPREASAQPPDEPAPPELRAPPGGAGGLGAIAATLRHASAELGLVRGARLLLQVNQKDGFDCPGCAWPEPDGERSPAEFCENGAKAVAEEATLARVSPGFFAAYSVAELSQRSDHWLGKQGRLTHPMVLREGSSHYEPLSWDEAFALAARELNALASPDEAAFYTSGRTSNEAAFLYQLFVRQLGTNNLPDCSNLCHESSGTGLSETIGIGKGTVTLDDFDHAQAIVVIGQNPGTNHPRMLTALQRAARRGAKIVSVNPLPEAGLQRFTHPQEVLSLLGQGTPLASLFLQVRINGDVALLQGVGKELLARGAVDEAFVRDRTEGAEAYRAHLEGVSWDDVVAQSGVPRERIAELAALLASTDRIIFCWAMGLTQHRNAVANVQEIVNLLLLRGAFGKRGAGACPVRGHSNVQGDRTMGIWERPKPAFLDALARECGFAPPRNHGLDVVHTIEALRDGRVKALVAMGGNFLSAAPDTSRTAEGLRRARFTLHVATKLNRAHLVTGQVSLLLPCLGRTERDDQESGPQFVTVENSMGVVHATRGQLEPASPHLRSEPAIVAGLARATLGARSPTDWEALAADYSRIRALIARVVPGCDDYDARVRKPGGFALPNGPREGRFPTPSGKAHFTVHQMPRWQLPPGQLLLMTIRSHDQFNTTIYGLDDRYRGVRGGRRVVFLNAADMDERGLRASQLVDLTSHFEGETRSARRFAVVPYDLPRGCAAAYFPEANALVPLGSVAEKSNTPASKSVPITVAPSERG
jgi:molybdopterin-dependent oxidoreductase alpha subunit